MLKIKWLGQSGYILSDGDTTICIDPYLSDVVNKVAGRKRMIAAPFLPAELSADIVICTHNHLDHLDIDAVAEMNKAITFLATLDCKEALADLGVKKYVPFDEGAVFEWGNFELKAVFADHTVPAVGVLVRHGGNTLYFSGDTYYNKKLEDIKCDIMFICINGKLGNMNVDEAVKLTDIIAPKTAVPNHYDMFESNSENPEKFTAPQRFIMEHNREYEVRDGCLI